MPEIVVYKKTLLRFDSVSIYDFDGEGFKKSLAYVIVPMP